MQKAPPSHQLTPILLSAAMPGFGQLLQGRTAMAVTQFLLTGLVWSMAACAPLASLAVLAAHGLSAFSAASYRPEPAAS